MDRQVVEVSSLSLSFFLFLWLSTYLPTYLSKYLSIYLSTYLPIYLSTYLSIYLIYLPIYLSTYLPIYLSTYLSIYLTYLPIYLPIYLSIYLPIYLSTYLPIYLSTYLPIYLSIYLIYLPIYLYTYIYLYLPIFTYIPIYLYTYIIPIYLYTYLSLSLPLSPPLSLSLLSLSLYLSVCLSCLSVYLSICPSASVKTKLFCETSSIKQRQKRNSSARLLHFLNLTTSKTKQFCETPSIFELDNIKNQAILRDFLQKWKIECSADSLVPMRFAFFSTPPVWSIAPATQNHLGKPTDLMLQNATPLSKSAPWPPNISDEHVFCTAPATENASLQILVRCPTPAILFGNATKPWRFAHFWQGAQSLMRPPRETTSEPPKVVQNPGAFNILTSKCASRHNGVHFFDIATSKSGPDLMCFVHFDLEMCFAPQRRAIFHLSSGQLAPHPPL